MYSFDSRIQFPALKLKWKEETNSSEKHKPIKTFSPLTLYYYYFEDLSTHNMADNSNSNPVAGGFGLNQQNQQQQQNVVQGNNQNMDAACLAQQILANTNVTMKTGVVKLLDFYGQPEKDTISALEFMARIDECQVTIEWNDTTTFSYFTSRPSRQMPQLYHPPLTTHGHSKNVDSYLPNF